VTLEAMASGLVVVAYDYAAARMHIANGETGVLVPCGESQAFVDAAVSLAQAPQSLLRMRRQARAYARSIDWPHVVEKFETLLTGALVRGHTAPAALITRRGVAI
jgi:glycosyltransferase involved in cell wall biosynthesis